MEKTSVTFNRKRHDYQWERVIEDNREVVRFQSDERLPRRLWLPHYIGQATLALYVARVEINDKKHKSEPITAHIELGPEVSMYAHSDDVEQRNWAAVWVAGKTIGRYFSGTLKDNRNAREFYESITPDQWQKINEFASHAE